MLWWDRQNQSNMSLHGGIEKTTRGPCGPDCSLGSSSCQNNMIFCESVLMGHHFSKFNNTRTWCYIPSFKCISPLVLEKIFEGFTIYGHSRQDFDQDHLNFNNPFALRQHTKFHSNSPNSFRGVLLWKCWQSTTTTTDSLSCYKLPQSLWKEWQNFQHVTQTIECLITNGCMRVCVYANLSKFFKMH